MTPLAAELVEDLYSKIYFRPSNPVDGSTEQEHLRSVFWTCAHQCKFFECSEVTQIAYPIAKKMRDAFDKYDKVDQRLAFLPAEWTWIEIESPGYGDQNQTDEERASLINEYQIYAKPWTYTYRTAFILIAGHGVTHMATKRLHLSYETPRLPGPRIWRVRELPPLPLVHSGLKPQRTMAVESADGRVTHQYDKPTSRADDFTMYSLLALINSPRIIGQQTHWPHQRDERERLKKMKLVGKFPLRAWTEIVLKVAPPENRSDEPEEERHLTGERCLHFCRTYLRVRNGQLEYIDGHWRGNPALGMKRSRYRLERDKQG
jgi:hypothetical protein